MPNSLIFYQILTIIVLFTVSFIPRLLDPKIPFIIYGYALILFPLFLRQLREKSSRDLPAVCFAVLLGILSLSTLFSQDKSRSLTSLSLYLSYFVVFVSARRIFRSFIAKKKLAKALILISVILSVIFTFNTLVNNYINRETEGVSLQWIYYGHSHLAALLILAIPLLSFFLIQVRKKSSKAILLSILLFLSTVLILTLSRASIISLAVALFILLLWRYRLSYKKKLSLTLGAGGVAVLIVAVLSFSQIAGVKKYFHFQKDPRVVYWQAGINNFYKYPLMGSGLDTFRNVAISRANPSILKSFYTHNYFIQMLTDAGIFGFLSSLFLIGSVFARGFKRIWQATGKEKLFYFLLMTGLLASGFNNLVDFDWQLPTIFLTFWLLVGMIQQRNV